MSGGPDHNLHQKAASRVRQLIQAVRGLGYDEKSAIEIVECLVEDAGRDGIDTKHLWSALDAVAPIPKEV